MMTGAGDNSVAWLKHEDEFPTIRRIMVDVGVRPSALPFFCIQTRLEPAFVFGFVAWTRVQIRESLLKLAFSLK